MTDSLGDSAGVVYPNTSYSAVAAAVTAVNATPSILAGPVDITGYLQDYYGAPELNPTSITPSLVTPEPASLSLLGLAGLALFARRTRKA